jgi:hypothetical protein
LGSRTAATRLTLSKETPPQEGAKTPNGISDAHYQN